MHMYIVPLDRAQHYHYKYRIQIGQTQITVDMVAYAFRYLGTPDRVVSTGTYLR